MRKVLMILTLAVSYLALTCAANAGGAPPTCDPNCPLGGYGDNIDPAL